MTSSTAGTRASVLGVAAICLAIVVVPLVWRPLVGRWGPTASALPPSFLPAVQQPRERHPFDPGPIEDLQSMKPPWVVIGDSMAGRVDPAYFTHISDEFIATILFNASGTGHWFLILKNYVVASGISPKRVIFFFRDTNLTDPMWRLPTGYETGLDTIAREHEDELNAVAAENTQGAWYRVHATLDRLYEVDRTRSWLDPALSTWLSRVVAGRQHRVDFIDAMNRDFNLEHLRPMTAADLGAAETRAMDFRANVGTSLLPHLLRMAADHHLKLCFVRVLRRPIDGKPPAEPPALQKYMKDLRQYLEANGAAFIDDRDDPELATLAYADGDHIARDARRRYTELFYAKLLKLPQ